MQSVARAAANGSSHDLESLCAALVDLSDPQAALTLPALFSNVDSARIPTSDELDNRLSQGVSTPEIDCAFQALIGFGTLAGPKRLPLDAAADLWPELWKWLDFFHTHWDYLPVTTRMDRRMICMHHVPIILALAKAPNMLPIIRATPRVRSLLAAAWKATIEDDNLFATTPAGVLDIVSEILSLLVSEDLPESEFEEVVDGVGGAVYDLAYTISLHCSRAASCGDLKITPRFLWSCFGFLQPGCSGSAQLQSALVPTGFLAPLINALNAMFLATPTSGIVNLCFRILVSMLESPAAIASAIEAGLLRVTVTIAASISTADRNASTKVSTLVTQLLQSLLPRSLFHYTVLVRLRKCIHNCLAFATSSKIESSAFSKEWKDFSALIEKRLSFLGSWEARVHPSLVACANVKCGKIAAKRKFRSCSACQSVDYCSADCQSVHWHSAHRLECKTLHARRLGETLCTRGRSFRKALLNADYRYLMINICLDQVVFMHEHPGEAFFTMLSYGQPHCAATFAVDAVSKLKCLAWDVQPEEEFTKAAGSGGRIDMHVVFQHEGHTFRPLLVPMHLATSELHDELRRIAELLPPGTTKADAFEIGTEPVESLIARLYDDLVFTH
ncbi:hypothetical protein C8R46DRAFT_1309160 [Mycena filopes]|nr:hypothetical protein C8R46DRAFT_1309160 [Mycena filopes]